MDRSPASLTPISLAILLALADEDRHGYGIIKEVERQSDGHLRLGTGSLYTALQRLAEEGLIAESDHAPAPGEDARRRYYALTGAGREAAREEVGRLARIVAVARQKRLVPGLAPGEA